MPDSKNIEFYLKCARPIGSRGCACCGCHKALAPEDKVVDCPDCAGIFCEDCIKDGTFDEHECEEDDDED